MNPIAIAEIICSIFVCLSLAIQFVGHDTTLSQKRLKLLYILTFISLLVDACAYIFDNTRTDSALFIQLIHFENLMTYLMSSIILLGFFAYCHAFFKEKTQLNKWIFRIPLIITLAIALVDAAYYMLGKLIVYENGRFKEVGTVPAFVLVSYVALLFYAPIVAFIKRKDVGARSVLLLSSYGIPIILSIAILIITGYDLSVIAGALAISFITALLQKNLMLAKIETEAAHNALAENNMRVLALEDNFESLYDVELDTGKYELFIKGETYDKEVKNKLLNVNEFFSDLHKNIDLVIYPEDRQKLHDVMTSDALRKALAESSHFDHYYRLLVDGNPAWFKIRVVYKNAEKKNVIIGVFSVADEMASKQKEEEQQRELINRMVSDDAVFLIDYSKDTRKTIHDRLHGAKNYSDEEKHSETFGRYINNFVAASDRKMMLSFLSPEHVMERLKSEPDFSVEYRDTSTGIQHYFEMRFVKYSDTEVLQSFKENDKKIIDRMIFEKLEDDYFAIFSVDLDTGLAQIIKDSPGHLKEVGTVTPYSPMLKELAENFEGEERKFFDNISDVEYMKTRFAKEDKASFTYKSHLQEGAKWGTLTGIVLSRHDDGVPSLFAIGFSLLDIDSSNIQDMQVRLKSDMQMIGGLAGEYHALYYYNISENYFNVYSLDAKKLPGAANIVGAGGTPIEMLHRFGASELVHPDDKHLFDELTIESMKERLAHRKKFTTRFRRKFGDEYILTELDIVKYEDVDEPANAIALGFAKRDAEIRSELALNSCFNVLSREISPNEAIDELLTTAGEFYGAERCYIFEYESNRESISNTFEWCAEGIESMKSRLQQVPAKEIDGWINEFKRHGAFYMTTLDDNSAYSSAEGRALLEMQGIESLISAPIMNGDEIVGLVGVDNPTKAKSNIEVLRTVAVVAYSEILKRKENDEEHVTLEKLTDTFISVYYVDLSRNYVHNWKLDKDFKDSFGAVKNYHEDMDGYISKCVAERDRERCKEMTSPKYILEQFKTKSRFSIDMTDTMLGYERNFVFDYVKISEDGNIFVICCRDVTESMEKERQNSALSDGLAREYHTVWLVEGHGEHRLHLFRSTGRKTVKRAVQRGLDEPTYDGTMVKYVMDSVHEDDRERVLEASRFENVVKETPDVGIYVVSYKRYCNDQGDIDYHQMCFARAVAEDGTVNYILAFRDADKMLREQISQQQQLQEALSMAQSANRAKTTFLNSMSHDIRTPMNAIIGFTGLAASHIDNKEQVQDYLSKIGQSSNHLLSLINDVLDMSRIESGKMNLDEKPESLPDIIHTLRDIVQVDIRTKQHDFFIDTGNVNDEGIICDKLRLNQVLLNILSNAIKYTAQGGTISMRISETTVKPTGYATYEFRVKDNGMGMDKDYLKTIFDPFTRVRSSTISGIQGTGLGMAITKNIVDMMGGRIDVQSELGKGTEITVTFDFKLQEAHKESLTIQELQGLRALIADDDANTCVSIDAMLKEIGMRTEWCTTGKEAIFRAETAFRRGELFKVYILDWLMPDMNGIETTRRIRKVIGDDTPIIILTAYDWSDIEEEAKEAGVTAFVSKPMFPSDLHRVLNKCLGKKEAVEETKTDNYDFNGKKVLLVEDNMLNREIAIELLTEYGCIITTAEDGSIAVDIMKQAKDGDFDIILMDIQMPVMNGYDATRAIRALGTPISKIPILAMTADAFEEDRKMAMEAGMNEHVIKPINVEKLREALAKFL